MANTLFTLLIRNTIPHLMLLERDDRGEEDLRTESPSYCLGWSSLAKAIISLNCKRHNFNWSTFPVLAPMRLLDLHLRPTMYYAAINT